jgi:hypothetical protein
MRFTAFKDLRTKKWQKLGRLCPKKAQLFLEKALFAKGPWGAHPKWTNFALTGLDVGGN